LNALRSVAILNPLGDFGINAYSFELAEGLSANGVQVDVYTSDLSPLSVLPGSRHHQCFPVLGSTLLKQKKLDAGYQLHTSAAQQRAPDAVSPDPTPVRRSGLRTLARRKFLELELAVHLKRKRYDLVWTQWPDIYGHNFWGLCRLLGVKTAHTVHNVLPHEESEANMATLRRVYKQCHHLIVHSEYSRKELLSLFPEAARKTIVAPLGIYTIYPRTPEARERVRRDLKVGRDQLACLICGGIRPYKNIDSSIAALADPRCAGAVLIVAGQEAGFPERSASDPLAHTRSVARGWGVEPQLRLIPRFLGRLELSELFEAADVLLLPYVKGYGSGLLLLGMTFRKYIVTTDTGGACEYLKDYPLHTLLATGEVSDIVDGITLAERALASATGVADMSAFGELRWATIARNTLQMIARRC
jgi:glycosyltransferase involved in cell wall biosynthesis